jgi:hypothetical protein
MATDRTGSPLAQLREFLVQRFVGSRELEAFVEENFNELLADVNWETKLTRQARDLTTQLMNHGLLDQLWPALRAAREEFADEIDRLSALDWTTRTTRSGVRYESTGTSGGSSFESTMPGADVTRRMTATRRLLEQTLRRLGELLDQALEAYGTPFVVDDAVALDLPVELMLERLEIAATALELHDWGDYDDFSTVVALARELRTRAAIEPTVVLKAATIAAESHEKYAKHLRSAGELDEQDEAFAKLVESLTPYWQMKATYARYLTEQAEAEAQNAQRGRATASEATGLGGRPKLRREATTQTQRRKSMTRRRSSDGQLGAT